MRIHSRNNSAHIVPIANYAQAKERYEKTTPIRGSDNIRPLGKNRRYKWVQIVHKKASMESPDDPLGQFVDVYACHMYGYDLITFYPNGDVVFDCRRYRGVSVINMVTYALFGVVKIGSMRGKWYLTNKKNQSFVLSDTEKTVFRSVDGDFMPKDVTPETVYRLNRKEMNTLRKRYKKFIDYACTALSMDSRIDSGVADGEKREITKVKEYFKLQDDDLLPAYHWNRKPNDKSNRAMVIQALDKFNESGDLELAYNLMYLIAHNAGKYSYRDSSVSCSPQAFKKYFEEILKYHFRDTLFKEEEVVIGTPFYDGNDKYVYAK